MIIIIVVVTCLLSEVYLYRFVVFGMEFICCGCPHLEISVIRGFTVINNIIKAMHDTILVTTGVDY